MLARVEQERLESLKYERATIYIKCIDENGETKTENDSEVIRAFHVTGVTRMFRERRRKISSSDISSRDDRRDGDAARDPFSFLWAKYTHQKKIS